MLFALFDTSRADGEHDVEADGEQEAHVEADSHVTSRADGEDDVTWQRGQVAAEQMNARKEDKAEELH